MLPNNSNVILSAEQAAELAAKPVTVVPTDSIPAGLAAMVAFDAGTIRRGQRGGDARPSLDERRDRRGDDRVARCRR